MRSWLVACVMVGAWSQAVAAEPVRLTFDWPDGEARRVVTTWRLDVLPPDGARATAEGTVREQWRLEREPTGWVLSNPQRHLVRAGESLDVLTAELARAYDVTWSVTLTPDGAVPRAVAAPVGAGEQEAPMVLAEPPEGSSISTETVEMTGDGTVQNAPDAVTEASAPTVGLLSRAEVRALIHGDREAMLERLFGTFHGQTMEPGKDQAASSGLVSPGTGEVDDASVVRRLVDLPFCPDGGPGTRCVELELVRAYGGADTRGSTLDAGQRRVVERWVVEPATMMPHRGEIIEQVVRANEAGERWTYSATRSLSFLPVDAPAPPEATKAL